MLRINQIKIAPDHSAEALKKAILKFLQVQEKELLKYQIIKKSIDARKKPEIVFVYTIDVILSNEEKICKRLKNKVQKVSVKNYQVPNHGIEHLKHKPVVVGAGPAGLFCAYLLAQEGFCPILLERGASVDERHTDVEKFWKTNVLNPHSNVQFGEGGAGTFSDGKLNTLVKDKFGRNKFVLETFVKFGAPEHILYEQKPHIGTDILMNVIKNMRLKIIEMGGEVYFHTQVTNFKISKHNEEFQLEKIEINHKKWIPADLLVLAIGHSARDTFQLISDKNILIQPKSFAVGVRIEHPQQMIQESQYGEKMADKLPAAAYKLAENLENGRGVYTFCMCPGGYVVNASSEEKKLAVNGMSYHDRAGENANSAVIVTVTPDDFESSDPLAGVQFQRMLEEKAFEVGNGFVPVQCFEDFCNNRVTEQLGDIVPQIKGQWQFGNVRSIFPDSLAESLQEGIQAMDRKIHGFARPDAILSGVESRTSSPVKIVRNDLFESSVLGIYPCGEGAGYAGGITSAAMDGMKVAEAIIQRFEMFTKN